jgi:uncharacterized protein (TIGR03083 family)
VKISPRYDGEPLMQMTSLVDDPATPLLRQRARLAALLAGLDDEQWAAPSRCDGWSVQDVVAHLITTNQFWAFSVVSGNDGAPTRLLSEFDPVAGPAEMVDAVRSWTSRETLDQFCETNDALAEAIDALEVESWARLAEAPPGHIAIDLVAMHALWDAWIHERDIVLPLGLPAVEEPDEIGASLAYVVALGPAFLASRGSNRTGTLEVVATDPDVRIVVEIGESVRLHDGPCAATAVTITGNAVDLLEALSFRAPLPVELADDDRWVLGDLGDVFDQAR